MDEKKLQHSRVRHYRKSSQPRLRWTPELHEQFVEVVQSLGGKYEATPKRIMQMMGVNWLKISHIKSHLQMYRSMKERSSSNQDSLKKEVNSSSSRRRRRNFGMKEEENDDGRYSYQSAQGTTSSAVTESDHRAEIPRANMELQPINFRDLSDTYHENCESSKHTFINLDLTM